MSLKKILALILWLFIQSCGQYEELTTKNSNDKNPSTQSKRVLLKREFFYVPIRVSDGITGFSLANASSYSISMTSCLSGFTSSANQASTNLQVYKSDRGCLAKLTAFTYDSVNYTPKSGSGFSTWESGNTAVFENAGHTKEIMVRVVNQISAVALTGDTVGYEFYGVEQGATKSLISVSFGGSDTLGTGDLPSFTIKSVEFLDVDATNKSGIFKFKLECTIELDDDLCGDVDLGQIDYRLVADTYENNPDGEALLADAQALFPTGEKSVDVGTDKIDIGTQGLDHGGFFTKSGGDALAGPNNMHASPNMILFLEANDSTFQYFHVDLNVSN